MVVKIFEEMNNVLHRDFFIFEMDYKFVASTFSSAILRSFYFFGFVLGLTCSRCSMMSLLTPNKSKVDNANTSLFLSRNPSSFVYSSWFLSAPMHTVLSKTLGLNSTFLNSPLTYIIFLYSIRGYALH
jgi:hypothetical protein